MRRVAAVRIVQNWRCSRGMGVADGACVTLLITGLPSIHRVYWHALTRFGALGPGNCTCLWTHSVVLNCTCTRFTRDQTLTELRLSLSSFLTLFCGPLTWVPRLIPETSSQSVTMGNELCFLFYFSTCPLAWSVIEGFQTSTSHFHFWFLFSKLVLYLTVLLSHDFSTPYAALRGPTSCRTIQLDVVQRLPPMQNTPRFLRRRLQPQPYSRTSASTPVQLTWTLFTPYRLSCLHRSPHSYA